MHLSARSSRPSRRVVIIDSSSRRYSEGGDIEQEVLDGVADVCVVHSERSDLAEQLGEADAIIAWDTVELGEDLLNRAARCRLIVRAGVGFDNIDLDVAHARNIVVANVPDYGTEEVADHTLALLLNAVRQIRRMDNAVRAGRWTWSPLRGSVPRLRGTVLGLVGFGRIGTAVARRALGFGLTVAFYDPYVPDGIEKSHGVLRYETLHDLIATVDMLSLHAPLSHETAHLIGNRELECMRPGAGLINTARGGLVDTKALVASLSHGHLGFAALDVIEGEPSVPEQLLGSERVLLTPHSAFYSNESLAELRAKSAKAVHDYLVKNRARNQVSRPRTPSFHGEHQDIPS